MIHSDISTHELPATLRSLISVEEPLITGLSNAAAQLYGVIPRINWCGFYLYDGSRLVLGPFGGKPACTVIALGAGVCGTSAARREVIRVPDVDLFPGHIACDDASRSEIVLPIILADGSVFGVLDLDSPERDRFSDADEALLRECVKVLAVAFSAILARRSAESSIAR